MVITFSPSQWTPNAWVEMPTSTGVILMTRDEVQQCERTKYYITTAYNLEEEGA